MHTVPINTIFDDASKQTGQLWVDALINGEKLRFILDTACAATTLAFTPFSKNFKSVGTKESNGTFGSYHYEKICVDTFTFGNQEKTQLVINRNPDENNSVNLLGMDILKDHNIVFDFPNSSLELLPDNNCMDSPHSLELDNGYIPKIPIICENTEFMAVWDSGAGITVADHEIIRTNSSLFEEIGSETVTDSGGTKMETPVFMMKSIKIGGYTFKSHKVAGVDLSYINKSDKPFIPMVLGFGALQQAKWWFDFPKKEWKILELS